MKKIYLLATAVVLSITAMAQSNLIQSATHLKGVRKAMFVPLRHHSPSVNRTSSSFFIDYPYYEDTTWHTAPSTLPSFGYRQPFIYDVNTNYTPLDSSTTSVVVTFDSIIDVMTPMSYAGNAIGSITVDSIFAQIGQHNSSGLYDTVRFKIINVTGSGATNYPGTTVYNTTDIISNTSISTGGGGSWLYSTVVYTTPGYTLPFGVKKFGVKLEYKAPLQDSLGIIAGFLDAGGPCGAGSYKPLHSDFYANSFRHVSQYTTYPYIPTAAGADFFYDCDASGGFTTGDGYSAFEDAGIWVYVTVTSVGIQEYADNSFSLGQNEPNPFTNQTRVNYSLNKTAANVAVEIYDIRGVKMFAKAEKNLKPGSYSMDVNDFNFASGIYFCTLIVDGQKITNKMVKQ